MKTFYAPVNIYTIRKAHNALKPQIMSCNKVKLPVGVIRAAVAVLLLLPPPVPFDQLTEVGRLLTVSGDELVFEELLRCGTLHNEKDGENSEKGDKLQFITVNPPGGSNVQQQIHKVQYKTYTKYDLYDPIYVHLPRLNVQESAHKNNIFFPTSVTIMKTRNPRRIKNILT